MTRVTLADVARAAGVSASTASRAVNGSESRTVRPELRERVLAAAANLGYIPDANAQAVARGRTSSMGLVVHDIADPYYSAVAAGVTRAADGFGMIVSLTETKSDPDREIEIIRMLDRQRAAAVVLAGTRLGTAEHDEALVQAVHGYLGRGGRVAVVGQPVADLPVMAVDNAAGAVALARALVALGYTDFGVAAGPHRHRVAVERSDALRAELALLGHPVPARRVVHTELTRAGGRAAAEALLAGPDRPRLVVAATDLMAVGVLAGTRALGLVAPDDVAVAGFDDIEVAADVTPALTTVRLPLVEMGARAADLALHGPDMQLDPSPVVGEVVVRASTPPLR